MVACAYNLRSWEVEAKERQIQSHAGIPSESIPKEIRLASEKYYKITVITAYFTQQTSQ